ncbi:MAG TPA: exo-alpha-sialidase [Candidatus Polarisedimenticolia bacterium]|nr:exo-alpha-sialidase [Candidatus Polarisedimenticolia bacterium]
MRKLPLLALVLLVAALALGDRNPSIAGTSSRKAPRKSGIAEFFSLTLPSGYGARAGAACDIGASTQPGAYQGNMLLDCDGETPHNETTIAANPLDPQNVVAGYHSYQRKDQGNDNIIRVVGTVSVTYDGGASWSEVIPPIKPYQFTGDPALAFDTRGRLYLATIADHEGPGGSFTGPDVVVATSFDGGSSWESPVTVAHGTNAATPKRGFGPLLFNDKDFLAVDVGPGSPYRDRAYVTWTGFETVFSPNQAFFRSPVMLSSSDDGIHWTEGRAISGFNRSLCVAPFFSFPGMCDVDQDSYPAVAPNGRVYVSFVNFNTIAQSQILVVSSSDGGATWQPPSRVDFIENYNMPVSPQGENVLKGCLFRMSFNANTAADPSDPSGRTVYVAFADNRNGTLDPQGFFLSDLDVFLGRSTDGGATWSVIPVNTLPNDQFFPWVSVAADGRVDVGYMDRSYSSGQEECRYGYSLTRLRFDASGTVASRTTTRVDSALSDLSNSFWFGPNSRFIGDYAGITVDSLGRTWASWTDQRAPVSGVDPRTGQHAVAGLVP